jgi:hypothetical protein
MTPVEETLSACVDHLELVRQSMAVEDQARRTLAGSINDLGQLLDELIAKFRSLSSPKGPAT